MEALAIRNELRESVTNSLSRKRTISFLATLGLIDFSIISLYQLGFIKKLPDLPFEIFDSNKVNASKEAYMLGAPDGPISLVGYAATILFATAGGTKNSGRPKVFDWALFGTIMGSAIGGVYYLNEMVRHQKKACIYCLVGAAINFAMLPLAIKELKGEK